MLILNRAQTEALLDLDKLVDALAPAMVELSAGFVSMPARIAALVKEKQGLLGAMPAYLSSSKTLACKLVSVFPLNWKLDIPSHQAVILLFDAETGRPLAAMDGTHITAARTAAGSALATRTLARPDAQVLLIVGTGVQARSHARAVSRVRKFREIRVAGRDMVKTGELAEELSRELKQSVQARELKKKTFTGADVICATTHAAEPVIRAVSLEPGMHINSVGLNQAGREVDATAVQNARVVVESRQAALSPPPSGANDLLWPIRDGIVTAEHVYAELGEILGGSKPGRTAADQVTLYKSVGVAVQDAVAARLVYDAASERQLGSQVEI
ncbi:MAG TPA: ornithine cyclodeaminase family protein [Gammaproteobacteria bacterium]|nr:ornithine cyclodeaminase family protein [Gammaproteobacteria bacterium]